MMAFPDKVTTIFDTNRSTIGGFGDYIGRNLAVKISDTVLLNLSRMGRVLKDGV
jgi:hypothetical protein